MRKSFLLFFIAQVIILGSLIYSVRWLFVLLLDDGASDAIHPADIPGIKSTISNPRQVIVPKIIHQTWKDPVIPDKWIEPQRTCLELHPDYEYKLWTDSSSRDFITKEFPWFLSQFDAYPHNIERADAIRYFILLYYGGVYIDLDDGCNRKLDPLLTYPAFVRKTKPTGISNDVMGAVPQHPFFAAAVKNLKDSAREWHLPYLTVMASTGPLFLSLVWLKYKRGVTQDADRVRIILADEYMGKPWSFFLHFEGSSWHNQDSGLIFWMLSHWIGLMVTGFIIGFGIIGLMFFGMRKWNAKHIKGKDGWIPLKQLVDLETQRRDD